MTPPCEADPFDLWRQMADLPLNTLSVLNLGSGKFDSLISKQLLSMPFNELYNVEVFGPYIEHASRLHYAAKFVRFQQAKIERFLDFELQYDVVLLLDVLEHLDKQTALHIWRRAVAIATRRVLLWIPVGECVQHEYDNNPFQEHHSTWELDELERLGRVEYFPGVHRHFNPPVSGAWVIWEPPSDPELSS